MTSSTLWRRSEDKNPRREFSVFMETSNFSVHLHLSMLFFCLSLDFFCVGMGGGGGGVGLGMGMGGSVITWSLAIV